MAMPKSISADLLLILDFPFLACVFGARDFSEFCARHWNESHDDDRLQAHGGQSFSWGQEGFGGQQ